MNRNGVALQHDNSRPHSAELIEEKIKQLGWAVLPHPPYFPDAAPSDAIYSDQWNTFFVEKNSNLTTIENADEEY